MFASSRKRRALQPSGTTFGEPLAPSAGSDQPFSEMAMYVLKCHNDAWRLAAGQNTPMRPGGVLPASE
jgi:hypothetical protein